MKQTIKGKSFVFDKDDVDTDMIIPAKYLNTDDEKELAECAMEFLDKDFPKKVKEKKIEIVVAGKNFGCGSSREHAVWCLTGNNVKAVIAEGFARIFFRNCVNFGLFPVVCPGCTKKISEGDELEIDIKKGIIKNLTKNEEYKSEPLPDFMMEIVEAGGLLPYVKKNIKNK
jgi:3-isopropylmalate/(R)-2-methylmalate dehydratase small subunit